jgi:hypothetical protein
MLFYNTKNVAKKKQEIEQNNVFASGVENSWERL